MSKMEVNMSKPILSAAISAADLLRGLRDIDPPRAAEVEALGLDPRDLGQFAALVAAAYAAAAERGALALFRIQLQNWAQA